MKQRHTMKTLAAAVIVGLSALPMIASAAAHTGAAVATGPDKMAVSGVPLSTSERTYSKAWGVDREKLEQALRAGADRAAYVKTLNDMGFTITSINADRPTYLEYEVVKARNSYEVQFDFDNNAAKAKKIDVTTNVYRTESTKAGLRGEKVAMATKPMADGMAYSDRERMKGWSGEKETLERALVTGQTRAQYEATLKKMGYQITSVNEAEKDYLEFEVVRGSNSYEVQIDLENKMGKKVDVTTNMWEAPATERALAAKKGK